MRAALGLVSLLLVLAVVGVLAKKQLAPQRGPLPMLQPAAPASAPNNARVQGEQVQEQYRQALEGALQQPRSMPDDAK
ncbi:hypothetical protein [Simplicispira lacusdiani]|uniref:hypothetical protein n=1 Tax=Simplicispira lacusdiani TaxID=2213010 RepID=UPI000E76EC11|nr:hypothetical protein [Simplicispira lacusdiani]